MQCFCKPQDAPKKPKRRGYRRKSVYPTDLPYQLVVQGV